MNKGFSSVLNASRWFAALLVLIGHARHIVLVDFKDVQNKDLLAKGFYFLTGLGHEAVVVFFVVSGLLVGALTLDKWQTRSAPGMADYFIHRFSRIYIVLIPALFGGLAMDYIGTNHFDAAQLYSTSGQYHVVSGVIKDNIDALAVLGNLAMLEGILVNVLGSNGPLWSLAYEWWYYCLWALAVGTIFYRGLGRWISATALIVLMLAIPNEILIWMAVWLLGVSVFYYGRSNLPKPHPIAGVALFLAALIASPLSLRYSADPPMFIAFTRDFGLGLAYSIALVSCYRLEKPLWLNGLHAKLASFSYSLYMVHFPLLILIVAVVEDKFGIGFVQQPSTKSYLYFAVIVVALYLYGFLFSLATEKHTFKLVTLLRRVFFTRCSRLS